MSQHSLFLPPKYNKTEPIITNNINPKTVIYKSLAVNFSLIRGYKNANITNATARLIKPFPNSLAIFLKPFIN